MKRTTLTLSFVSLLLGFGAGAALASGSSYPAAATAPAEDPMLVTESMKCRVVEIRAEENALKIQDPKTEKTSWITLDEDTRLLAQDKKAFDGRKKLEFADLENGQLLRIQHRPNTGQVLKIKVLRES